MTIEIPKIEKKPQIEEKSIQEIMEFRRKQSYSSRLAEYITGIRPDDPKMPDRLIEDQKIVRAKYGLPSQDAKFETPSEYEHFLRSLARKNKISIRKKSDYTKFFKEHTMAGGLHSDKLGKGNTAVVDLDKKDLKAYVRSLGFLEHEIIHGLQQIRFSNMPIELQEYEAYVAGLNVKKFRENPEDIEYVFFSFFVGGSVGFWYKYENNKRKNSSDPEIKPEWEDPEFFLKNIDKIYGEDIESDKSVL